MAQQDGDSRAGGSETAELLDRIGSAAVLTRGDLNELLARSLPDTRVRGGNASPDEALRTDELAAVAAELNGERSSLGKRLTGLSRYDLRRLRDQGLFPSTARNLAAGAPVSGRDALILLRGPLAAAAENPPAEIVIPDRAVGAPPGGPWIEWDLREAASWNLENDEPAVGESLTTVDLRVLFGPSVVVETALEGSVTVDTDGSDTQDLILPAATLSVFRDGPQYAVDTSLRLGRQAFGPIITDGIRLQAATPAAVMRLGAGYTGLVPAELNGLPATADDLMVNADRPVGRGDFSPRRLVGSAEILLPEILGRQNPSAQMLVVLDPEALDEADNADRLGLFSAILGLSGPVSRAAFYDLSFEMQHQRFHPAGSSVNAEDTWAWSFAGQLRWFPGLRSTQRLDVGVRLAGEDYAGVAPELPWYRYGGGVSNVVAPELGYTRRIAEALRVEGRMRGLARLVDNDETTNNRLIGAEGQAKIGIQVVPDLIFDLNASIFLPVTENGGGVFPNGSDPLWSGGFTVTAEL